MVDLWFMEIEMRFRPSRLPCVLAIILVCLVGIATLYVGLSVSRVAKEGFKRQRLLFLETDFEALRDACLALEARVETGELKSAQYRVRGDPGVGVSLFPKIILDLEPSSVFLWKGEPVRVELGGGFHAFGVVAFRNEGTPELKGGDVRLVPGLWYYDSEYDEYPWARTRIQELVQKGMAKQGDKKTGE